jgi:hypothetical protein
MAEPTPPPDGGATVWTAPPAPSWTTQWQPPGQLPAPSATPPRTGVPRGRLAIAFVAVAGVLAGAIDGAFLVMAVFAASAEDIGREIAAEVGPDVAREAGDGVVDALGDLGVGLLDEEMDTEEFGWGAEEEMPPVVEHPAVEPGELGPDPVLDQYALDCFEGDLQACDDLMYESPPLSDYEQYGLTCGGRVKQYMVMYCTDLE